MVYFPLLLLFLPLTVFSKRKPTTRDAWLVQTLLVDEYARTIENYNSRATGNLGINSVMTELYLGPSSIDPADVPMRIGYNVEQVDGSERISPAVQFYDTLEDIKGGTTPGASGGLYRVVTSLGGVAVPNAALYSEKVTAGGVIAQGLVPERWFRQASRTVSDPALSDFMKSLYQQQTKILNDKYPGVAQRIQAAYEIGLANSGGPADPNRIQNNMNIRRTARPTSGGASTLIDVKASHDLLLANEASLEREIEARLMQSLAQEAAPIHFGGAGPSEAGPSHLGPWASFDEPSPWNLMGTDDEMICSPFRRRSMSTSLESRQSKICKTIPPEDLERIRGPTSSVEIRNGGKLRTFLSVGGRTLPALGPAGDAVAAAFVILELVAGQWQAAAWTAGSIAAGLTTGIVATSIMGATALAGPVGIFIGLAAMALFAIFPGIFEKKHTPKSNNPTEIVQWAFFGDATHTGNEKCNENLESSGQEPNCTVAYGLSVISGMFDWNVYDASIFMINFNEGHAMTIPDLASSFAIFDHTNPSATANAVAIIDCGDPTSCSDPDSNPVTTWNNEPERISCAPSVGYTCDKPVFKINRDLITLPGINQGATETYNQVNSGECKIVSDPVEGEILYPPIEKGDYTNNDTALSTNASATADLLDYFSSQAYLGNIDSTDLTSMNDSISPEDSDFTPLTGPWSNVPAAPMNFTGKPISIACNLTADIPNVLDPNYSANRSGIYTSANSSTSGDTSYFVPPPKPFPFTPLDTKSSICLSSSSAPGNLLCLPNGTFPTCQGAYGFTSKDLDTLTFPTGKGTLKLNIDVVLDGEGSDKTPSDGYTDNVSADPNLQLSFQAATKQKHTFDLALPPGASAPAPALCVFSLPNYLGDVWCMGPGGTNFTSNIVNKISSFTLSAGLVGWFYPGFYGNPLGNYISTSVANVKDIPFHTGENFQGNIAAAWIFDARNGTTAAKMKRVNSGRKIDPEIAKRRGKTDLSRMMRRKSGAFRTLVSR